MKTLFVVDDSRTNLAAAHEALAGSYKTLQMTSAERMFGLLGRIMPDLILLDIAMPEMDGFEAISVIKALPRFKHIPIVFLTAADDKEQERRGFEMGAVGFIHKPFTQSDILRQIDTLIG